MYYSWISRLVNADERLDRASVTSAVSGKISCPTNNRPKRTRGGKKRGVLVIMSNDNDSTETDGGENIVSVRDRISSQSRPPEG